MVSSRQVLSSLLVASLALAKAQGPGGMSEDGFIAQSVSMDGPSGSMDEPSGPPSDSMDGEPMEEDLATVEPTSEETFTESGTIPPVPIGPLCSVYPLCKASNLEGNCCPSDNGEMLSCCMGVLDEDEDFEVDDEDEALSGDDGPAMTTGSVGGMDTPVNITVGEVTYYDMNETLSEDLSEDLLDEDLGPPTVAPTTTYAPTEMGTTGAPTDTFQPTWGGSTYAPTKMPILSGVGTPTETSSEDTTAAATDSDADAVATPSSAARISTSLVTVAVALGALFLC